MPGLLIIAYYFPPLGGVGAQRPLKFARYLPDYNWQPTILSVRAHHNSQRDPSLEQTLLPSTPIEHTPALILPEWIPWRVRSFISRYILLVDEQIGWLPFAVVRARQIIATHNIQAIFTTSPPNTTHLIGQKIKHATNLPWIADFRDPWVGNSFVHYPSTWHTQFAARLEKNVVLDADRVITVSEPMRVAFLQRYPDQPQSKFHTLTNGYDPADFLNIIPAKHLTDRFTIVYIGSFYGQRRTPHAFLRALRMALDRGQVPPNRIMVHFIGSANPYLAEEIEKLSLQEVTRVFGFLPHSQALAHLASADMTLLIIGAGPGSEGEVTGKIYEYLASHKPLLALVPPGAAADIIRAAEAGVIVPPDDIPAIATQIGIAFELWQNGHLTITPRNEIIARYDRRRLTEQLAALLPLCENESLITPCKST